MVLTITPSICESGMTLCMYIQCHVGTGRHACADKCSGHNATCDALEPMFFIGTDKHAYLEKAVSIGGDVSLRAYAYKGLEVTEIPEDKRAELLPKSITENEDLAQLICIR